jgi:hypothetical protein
MLAADQTRNELICTDVIRALEDRRSSIVLTELRDHLESLAERLREYVPHLIVLQPSVCPCPEGGPYVLIGVTI